MKRFCELPLVERDPATALVIEDGRSACIRMDDYEGLRNLAEVLAFAVPASDLCELSLIAQKLNRDDVRVLRVSDAAGFVGVLSPNDFDCLAEVGITIFAIPSDIAQSDDGEAGAEVDESQQLVDYFIWLSTRNQTAGSARWEQLAFYTSAVRRCGVPFRMPFWLQPVEAMLIADAVPWWGFPQAASTRQAMAFSEYVVDLCVKFNCVDEVIQAVKFWVQNTGHEHHEFDQMFQALKAEMPR